MPRHLLHALLALALVGAGVAATYGILASQPEAPQVVLPGPRPVPVETEVVEPRSVARPVAVVGTLRAAREVVLASEVGGRIDAVAEGLVPGAVVEAGTEVLAIHLEELDREIVAQRTQSELARTRLASAEADVERAAAALSLARESLELLRSEEDRWRELVDRDRAERARYDLARRQTLSAALAEEEAAARLQTARASVDLATLEIRLSEDQLAVLEQRRETARVVAPFTGRFVPTVPGAPVPEIGRVLAPAEPIGTLVDVASLRLVAEIHEDDVAALHVGALAAARPLSRPGAEIVGEVRAIGAFVEPITRSVTVEALFDDPLGLPAGTSADVVLEGQPLDGAIWVDERWIGYRDGRAVVFVVGARGAEGLAVAEARELDLAPRTYDGGRLVRAGLARGDEVVTSSIELIGDGSLCRPVEAARRASTRSELGVPR